MENKNSIKIHTRLSNQLYELGKLPPQAVELEEALLGAIMLDREAFDEIPFMRPQMLYKQAHILIYEAFLDLQAAYSPIDILTVTMQLKKNGTLELVGGAYYISQLTNRVASAANLQFHAKIIQQKFLAREVIRISTKSMGLAYDDTADVFDLLDGLSADIFAIDEFIESRQPIKKMVALIEDERNNYYGRVNAARQQKLVGVNTGFVDLNRITGGWKEPDLIIIAARPAMGKTALAVHEILEALKSSYDKNHGVGLFSLEMSAVQITERMVLVKSEVHSGAYKFGTLGNGETEMAELARNELAQLPIFIDDTPSLSIFDFRAKARKLKQQHDVQLIVVDYLQLMTATNENGNRNGNRDQEIGLISRGLKAVAKELKIPIIALSQLSRAVETRGGEKKPQLSDLRESGNIEQDADTVIFIHRPEYYGVMEDEEGNSNAGIAELIIAKHRNGAVGSVKVKFIDKLTKFIDPHHGQELFPKSEQENAVSAMVPNTMFLRDPSQPSSLTEIEEDPF